MSKSTAVVKSDQLLEDMDSVTREIALACQERYSKLKKATLEVTYTVGSAVNNLLDSDHLDKARKDQELNKLSKFLNLSNVTQVTLRQYAVVAKTFELSFLREQIGEKMADGSELTWTHFVLLSKIPVKRQMALLKQIRQESLSSNDLARELQARNEAIVHRTSGRSPAIPKTPIGVLHKIFSLVQQTDNYLTAVADPLSGSLMELDDVDEKFMKNIDDTLTKIGELRKHIDATDDLLRQLQIKSEETLHTKVAGDEETEAEETDVPETEELVAMQADDGRVKNSTRKPPKSSKPKK